MLPEWNNATISPMMIKLENQLTDLNYPMQKKGKKVVQSVRQLTLASLRSNNMLAMRTWPLVRQPIQMNT